MHREIVEKTSALDGRFLNTPVPFAADVEKMSLHREPIACLRPTSPATRSYEHLWDEIKQLERVREG